MQTIVEKQTGISKYLFNDSDNVTLELSRIITEFFIIGDMNLQTATLYKNISPPEDWIGCKYSFDGEVWTLNPTWIDPNPSMQEIVHNTLPEE